MWRASKPVTLATRNITDYLNLFSTYCKYNVVCGFWPGDNGHGLKTQDSNYLDKVDYRFQAD